MNSIEWLINQLTNVKYNPLEKNGYSKSVEKIHEQAKEMHREEIINAWEMGRFNIDDVGLGKEYYQETFKTTKDGFVYLTDAPLMLNQKQKNNIKKD